MDAAKSEDTPVDLQAEAWPIRLFNKSPLKQRKLRMIQSLTGETSGKVCLDIGSDNGVISYFLRQAGGIWYSADLIPETVASIRSLVHERVDQIDGLCTPYPDDKFDLVVIVDFLEHIQSDLQFAKELDRIIKPGGKLIVNVPNPKRGVLRAFKNLIGQTDAAHGHVRPGYSLADLNEMFGASFDYLQHHSYSRIFSELIDTAITAGLDLLQRKGRTQKGSVVTGSDLKKLSKSFKLYSMIYPIVAFFAKLDSYVPFLHGGMLIASYRKRS